MQSIKRIVLSLLLALSLLCSPAALQPTFATILFAGGEDVDFSLIGDTAPSNTSGFFRTGYARSAIRVSTTATTDPNNNRFYTPTFTAGSTIWFHAVERNENNTTETSNGQYLCAISPDAVCRLVIRAVTGTQVKISKRDSAGSFTDLVTCSLGAWPLNSLTEMDWFINYNTSGSTIIYVGGVNICSYTGNVTTDSATQINQFYLSNGSAFHGTYWSEIIIADTDTRDMNLFTCFPSGAGTTQSWTGAYTDVSPVTITDTAAITTTSTSAIGNFTCPSLPSGAFTVPAVVQSARVQGATGSITNFRFNSRPAGAGADFDTTSDIAVTGIFQNYPNRIITLNPNTSTPWTTTTLGAGVNFGVKSRP